MSHVNKCGVDLRPLEDWPFPTARYITAFWSFQAARSSPRLNGGGGGEQGGLAIPPRLVLT